MVRDELPGGRGPDVLGPGDRPARPPVPRRAVGLGAAVTLLLAGGAVSADRLRTAEVARPVLAVAGVSALEAGPDADAVAVEVDLVNRGPVAAVLTGAGGSFAGLRLAGAAPVLSREGAGRLLTVRPGEARTLRLAYRVTDCVGLRRDRVDLPVTVRLADGREETLRLEMPTADGPRRRRPVNGRGPLRRDLVRPREWQGLLVEPVCRGALPALQLVSVRTLEPGRDGGPRVRAELVLVPDRAPLRVTAVVGSAAALQVEATRVAVPAVDRPGEVSFDYRVDCERGPLPARYVVGVVVLDDDLRTVRTLRVEVSAAAAVRTAVLRLAGRVCPAG